jgi:sugar/nucleoside kinase (ribokinase family)
VKRKTGREPLPGSSGAGAVQKTHPPGVLCFGNLVVDTLARPVVLNAVRWDATVWVDALEQQIGGNGANTSFTLATLGVPVRLVGAVGDDSFGEFVTGRLANAGVDVAHVARLQAPTPATIALVREDGARALLHRPGASAEAFAELPELTPNLIAGCTVFHLANPFGLPNMRAHAARAQRRAQAAGLFTTMDTGWDSRGEWMQVVSASLAETDLLFTNGDEASALTGCADADCAARALRESGAKTVVVKLGGRGCLVADEAGIAHLPAFAVTALDTTGAGDCFVGGFLAAFLRGAGCREAARFANAVGALSVQRMGATAGLRGFDETLAWMDGPAAQAAFPLAP